MRVTLVLLVLAAGCTRPPEPVEQEAAPIVEPPRVDVPVEIGDGPMSIQGSPAERDPVAMTEFDEGTVEYLEGFVPTDNTVLVPAFAIDNELVTHARYDECVAQGGCTRVEAPGCASRRSPNAPITCVAMYEAMAYCEWAGKQLPTFDQWSRAEDTLPRMSKKHSQWRFARPCSRFEPWCRQSSWTVDGLREPFLNGSIGDAEMSGIPPHETMPGLAFRCARPIAEPTVALHPGPCWASCDGCDGKPDGIVDLRHVARWSPAGELVEITVLPANETRPTEVLRAAMPNAFVAAIEDEHVLVRDPAGRVIVATGDAADERHSFTRDATGNIIRRAASTDRGVEYWRYDYGCWDDAAPARLDEDVVACPRHDDDPTIAPDVGFGRCVAGPNGRWSVLFTDVSEKRCDVHPPRGDDEDCWERILRGRWALRYTKTDGTTFEAKVAKFLVEEDDVIRREPIAAFDYDGDGHQELVLSDMSGALEDAGPAISVWSLQADAVVHYAPAKKIPVESVADVDGDGRPDLLTRAHLGVARSYGAGMGYCTGVGITSVFHSNADGTFTMNDASTREHLAAQCGKSRTVFGRKHVRDGEAIRRLACMYLQGTTAAELRRRLDAEAPSSKCYDEYECECQLESYDEFIDALPPSAHGLLKTR